MLIILNIFCTMFPIRLTQALPIKDFLTKKSLRQWFQNETHMLNNLNPFCSICCIDMNQPYKGRKCGVHTMCAFESKNVGAACKGLIKIDLNQNEIDAIVDAHNTVRNRIALGLEEDGDPGPQPPAANMRLLSWDPELARVASVWATQCVFRHDKCRDLARFPVGQNLASGTYASKSDLEHVAGWYESVQYCSKDILESYDQKKAEYVSDYTQLVWADTYLVGCARISFQTSTGGQPVYRDHFFCNYGPSGNIPQQPVYKIGEACTGCSEGTFCTDPEYPGLCGNDILNDTSHSKRRRKRNKLETSLSMGSKPFCFNTFLYIYSIWFILYIAIASPIFLII